MPIASVPSGPVGVLVDGADPTVAAHGGLVHVALVVIHRLERHRKLAACSVDRRHRLGVSHMGSCLAE
jgi:hypothetical protein